MENAQFSSGANHNTVHRVELAILQLDIPAVDHIRGRAVGSYRHMYFYHIHAATKRSNRHI